MTNHPNRSKQQQAKHTPGPWHQRGVFAYDEHGSQMFNVRPTDAGNDAYREAEHRVAEIVAAHNCHAELLALAQDFVAIVDESPRDKLGNRAFIDVRSLEAFGSRARAAIAKAEGR